MSISFTAMQNALLANGMYEITEDTRLYAELKAYDKIKDAVCFALNSIKGEANTVSELRHFDSVLDMTLFNSRMRKETLDAMFTAIDEALPRFHAYLRHKAELLG